jgi:hypothetical protein
MIYRTALLFLDSFAELVNCKYRKNKLFRRSPGHEYIATPDEYTNRLSDYFHILHQRWGRFVTAAAKERGQIIND